MIKFINIKSVLSHVPQFLLEEESEQQIISWAYQGYKQNVTPIQWKDDLKVCVKQIEYNKISLPKDIKKIVHIGYSLEQPEPIDNPSNPSKQFLTPEVGDDFVLLSQAIAFTKTMQKTQALRYVGQNPELFSSSCVNLFCGNNINFSVNKQLTQLTTDADEGWIIIVYSSTPTDDKGNILIPDDADLVRAMSLYAEAIHWQNRSGRKEEGAENLYITRLQMADSKFSEYKRKTLWRNFNSDDFQKRVLGAFNSLHHINQLDYINRKK